MIVPLGTIIAAEDLDQGRGAVLGDFGDTVVAILGLVRAAPDQLATTAAPAARRIEDPLAARQKRAAQQTRRGGRRR
jgi:hypothetical protein